MITRHYCPVEPTGQHRYMQEAKVVYTLHPRCEHCGFIDVDTFLEAEREEARRVSNTRESVGTVVNKSA